MPNKRAGVRRRVTVHVEDQGKFRIQYHHGKAREYEAVASFVTSTTEIKVEWVKKGVVISNRAEATKELVSILYEHLHGNATNETVYRLWALLNQEYKLLRSHIQAESKQLLLAI